VEIVGERNSDEDGGSVDDVVSIDIVKMKDNDFVVIVIGVVAVVCW
jgi:hypothetical protein